MPRLIVLLVALLAAAFPASAGAAESFLGVLSDGRAATFSSAVPTALGTPRAIRGLERGDRVVALAPGLALGRSGRIYRFDAGSVRATATAARVEAGGARNLSLVATGAGARVLGDNGLDVGADLTTGALTPGTGLRRPDGGAVAPSVAALPDGRLTGLDIRRETLITETAPGSGVVAETPLRRTQGRLRFASPVAFTLAADGRGYALVGLPDLIRRPQSRLMQIDFGTARASGDSGPYFATELRALLPLGTVTDTRAPRASFVDPPRTVSLRALRRTGGVTLRVRCSEACIVHAASAVGGRTNVTTSRSRYTPGVVVLRLYRLGEREARLIRHRLGKTVFLRAFVRDWENNQVIIERRVRLTR